MKQEKNYLPTLNCKEIKQMFIFMINKTFMFFHCRALVLIIRGFHSCAWRRFLWTNMFVCFSLEGVFIFKNRKNGKSSTQTTHNQLKQSCCTLRHKRLSKQSSFSYQLHQRNVVEGENFRRQQLLIRTCALSRFSYFPDSTVCLLLCFNEPFCTLSFEDKAAKLFVLIMAHLKGQMSCVCKFYCYTNTDKR